MADGSTTLLYRFLGLDMGAGAQFDRMAGKTAMLGEASSGALAKLKALTVGGAVGVAALGVVSLKMASDYQRSMTLIQTQAGASKAEVDSFSKSLLAMAGDVAQSPEALSVSLYHVYSALKKVGADGPQMLNAVRIAAEGAKVGNTDLEDTTNSLTATLASGIVRFDQASKAMGYLNAIVGAGDMHFSDLNQALGTGLLVTMKTFGVSLKDTGAALAVFGDNNIRGADAATKLRMSVQDLAKPAAGKAAAAAFAAMNLNASKLRSTLENNGLNAALHLLKNHLDAAGITGTRIGGVLEDAFTKKAGAGLAILLTRLQQFDEARTTEAKGAAGFGDAWQATTHTLSFAMDRLKAEAEAAMIALGDKLLPAATKAADWLGTNLPHALSTLKQALAPTISMVGSGLAGAWKLVAAVVPPVAHALSDVIGFLARTGVLNDFAKTVLLVWAAFKGYAIAVAAFKAVQTAIILTRVRLLELMATGALAVAAVAALTLGFYALGKGIASWVDAGKSSFAVLNSLKAATDEWRDSLQQSNGALTDNIRLSIAKQLQDTGLDEKAAAAGISLEQLTAAVSGNDAAFQRLIARWKAGGSPSQDTLFSISALHGAYKQTAISAKELGTVVGHSSTDMVKQSGASKEAAAATLQAAQAAQKQREAIAALTTSLQKLISAEISQLQTQDSFKEGLLGLKKQVKDNGDSLSQNTQKGLANRDMLLGILSSAEQAAEGSKNYGKALRGNVGDFIAAAKAAGFNKGAIDRLLGSARLLQSQISKHLSMPPIDTSAVTQSLTATIADASYIGAQMGTAFNQAFKRANGIASPSKVFRQYGIWIVQGLINGVKSYTARAKSVAKELALGITSGWKDGTSALKDALTSPVQKVLNRLTTVIDNAISRQQDHLKKARDNLKNLLKQRASDIRSLASTVGGGSDLGNLFGTDDLGNPTVTNVNTFLSGQAKTIENFAKDLKWAAKHHLSPALLSEIAGLGSEQGDQVLQQFMSGQASIVGANRAESAIQHYSTAAARTAEDAVYAKRVKEDRKAVRENTVELRHLTQALRKIERQTARAAAVHLTVDAKTGKPVVDKEFIKEIIKGIREAQRVAGRKLLP